MLTAVPKRLRRQVLGVVDLSGSRGLEVPEGRLTERFEEASLRPPIHRLPLSLSQPSVFSVPLWLDSQRRFCGLPNPPTGLRRRLACRQRGAQGGVPAINQVRTNCRHEEAQGHTGGQEDPDDASGGIGVHGEGGIEGFLIGRSKGVHSSLSMTACPVICLCDGSAAAFIPTFVHRG